MPAQGGREGADGAFNPPEYALRLGQTKSRHPRWETPQGDIVMRIHSSSWLSAALVLGLAGAAIAQEPPKDRAPTRVNQIDMTIIQEALKTVGKDSDCMAEFVVGKDGKTKDIKPNCQVAEYDPFVVRAITALEYLPEIFAGEIFESDPLKQPFKFVAPKTPVAAAAPAGTPPVVSKPIEPKDVSRAINRINEPGTCKATFTVGVDGKPKDIQPNCTPDKYNKLIGEAIGKMRYTPGQKGGQAVDWPGVEFPLTLTKPNG
jgi:hypothetical protein